MRQSFTHGRTKAVVVEKVKRRIAARRGRGERRRPPASTPAPRRRRSRTVAAGAGARRRAAAPRRRPAPKPSGVVLRTLTEDERNARAHALAEPACARPRSARSPRKRRHVRVAREPPSAAEREAAEARKRDEEDRRRHDDETKRKAEPRRQEALRRRGSRDAATAPAHAGAARRSLEADEDGSAAQPRRRGGVPARPAAGRRSRRAPARREAPRPPHLVTALDRRRGARALGRLVPPPLAAHDRPSRHEPKEKIVREVTSRRRSPSRSSPTAWRSAASTSSSS